jgi:hypothetical protein
MVKKFIKFKYVSDDKEFELIANVDDILRLWQEYKVIDFKTPFDDKSVSLTLTRSEFNRVKDVLLEYY